jgi:hypothetical protein
MERNIKTKAAILRWGKAKRKEAILFLQSEKERRGCEICHLSFPYYVLDLDHLNQEEKPRHRGRSNGMYVKNLVQARKLLSISQVTCAVCHRIKTDLNQENQFNNKPQIKGHTGKQNPSFYRKIERRRREVREFLAASKTGPCKDCKNNYPPVAMDFDHLFNKICGVSKIIKSNISITKLKSEISKCDLICANCHRIRTHSRQFPSYIRESRSKFA